MNERLLQPGNVAAGALLIGGVLIVALPRHAVTIVQLVIVTVAVSAAIYVLARSVPPTGWISPFKWMSPFSRLALPGRLGHRSDEVDLIRAKLSGRRQRVEGGASLPPAVLRQLQHLIASALELEVGVVGGALGLGVSTGVGGLGGAGGPGSSAAARRLAAARERVSPLTWAVLTAEPLERPRWYRTLRPDPRRVAATVHEVLADLERAAERAGHPYSTTTIRHAESS